MNFILGTATFGTKYGIANNGPNVGKNVAHSILKTANEMGINVVDTAPAYGTSEEIIGEFHSSQQRFNVQTKISASSDNNADKVIRSIEASKTRLNIDQIDVLYFHSSDFLLNSSTLEVQKILNAIKRSGYVHKIGASVYAEDEVIKINNLWEEIEVFQVPENILDQRLLNSETIARLASTEIEFYVRSIFLQGLLLMDKSQIPLKLSDSINYLNELEIYCRNHQISLQEACLNYLTRLTWASGFLIGASTSEQLRGVLERETNCVDSAPLPKPMPLPLIDPRSW